jgi:mannose-6-phosphate isomerase
VTSMHGPVLLRDDNFTPPSRTPWGGRRIPTTLRAGSTSAFGGVVGEAWEFSVEPAFPSLIQEPEALRGQRLDRLLATDPVYWMGRTSGSSLLLKTIDAADRLSLQVHPSDDFAGLGPNESGKPEAWIVLDHAPGAGIWLGLANGVGRRDIEAAIDAGQPLEPLLHFVPVARGDAFVIGPGTVHAIGAGVTLLEPQLVRPGFSGLTYRFWDWGRRYDAAGRPDPNGTPRPIHRAEALAVTAWDAPGGAAFEAVCRRMPEPLDAPEGFEAHHVLDLGPVSVERHRGSGMFSIATDGALVVVHVAAGRVRIGELDVTLGQTVVIPAGAGVAVVDASTASDVFVLRERS